MRVRDPARIVAARRRAGYTQYDLAALVRCTQAAISALETGAMSGCSEELAHALARWLRSDVTALFEPHSGSRPHRVTNAAGTRRRRTPAPEQGATTPLLPTTGPLPRSGPEGG